MRDRKSLMRAIGCSVGSGMLHSWISGVLEFSKGSEGGLTTLLLLATLFVLVFRLVSASSSSEISIGPASGALLLDEVTPVAFLLGMVFRKERSD
jgi:hypothetical protein